MLGVGVGRGVQHWNAQDLASVAVFAQGVDERFVAPRSPPLVELVRGAVGVDVRRETTLLVEIVRCHLANGLVVDRAYGDGAAEGLAPVLHRFLAEKDERYA